MTNRSTTPLTDARREGLEARFALRVTARLNDGAEGLPHDISERLRVARHQAVEAARLARLGAAGAALSPQTATAGAAVVGVQLAGGPSAVVLGQGNSNWNEARESRQVGHGRRLDDGPVAWGWRLASLLPVLALIAGLWGVHLYHAEEKVQAAADVDTALLTDDLPPDAYADPGFSEYLRSDNRTPVRPLDTSVPEPDGDLKTSDTAPAVVTP
ncbi:DUF3619 family protein [Aquabacterium sp.]|uniref:DUF3619 family protein n=1 Tax=Aquabacterium sp. TaxID=1872578 RepID=UPI0035C78542